MIRRLSVLVSCLLLVGGLGACGGGELTGDAVPPNTPEILPPPNELGDAPRPR